MKTQEKIIEAMNAAWPNESQAAHARRAGLSPNRYNNYVVGIRQMDVDAVIGCAQALGWDVRKTVADHMREAASTPRERALWQKFAATAAGMLMIMSTALPLPTNAKPLEKAAKAITVPTGLLMYYAKRNGWLWTLRAWLAWKLRRSKPGPGNKEVFAC